MPKVTRLRTRENPEVRSRRILEEAVRLIGERGCNGFTVDELAKRCEISKGGLLHYFDTKESLLIAIVEEAERSEIEALAPLIENALGNSKDGPSRDAALALFSAIFARSNEDRDLRRLHVRLNAEAVDPAHLAHASIRRREAAILGLFTRVLTPFTEDALSAAHRLTALLHGLTLHCLLAETPFDPFVEWMRAVEQALPLDDGHEEG